MKRFLPATILAGAALFALSATAQINDFGARAVELRGISADDLAKPDIPDDAIITPPNSPIPRPLYLVYRYYACGPWFRSHLRSFYSSVPGFDPAQVIVDTADDTPELQIVNEQNEQRLGLNPGTAINHPAYGLYCLRVVICVPWDQWQPGLLHRFYVRMAYHHPYICWWEHWWYYWRSPLYAYQVQLNSSEEVPPNGSTATGIGTLFLDPIYRNLCYDVVYGGLGSPYSVSHIHGPAGPGTNASPIFTLNNIPASATAGRLFGVTPPLSAAQQGQLQTELLYLNLHSVNFPNGEIRSQIRRVQQPVYCPWRPSWIPLLRWGRTGPVWCLTVTHPYGYGWDPWYRQRPFCIYGLRYFFTPIGNIRTPASMPYIGALSYNGMLSAPWQIHPGPLYGYWPYSPYCARWYWWICTPFSTYRHLPPIVQFATWVNPDPNDQAPGPTFPPQPQPGLPGTVGISTMRAFVSQQGDINGDGFENLADLSAFRQEQGTSSQDTVDTDGVVGPAQPVKSKPGTRDE
jgi:hypothetical protein